MTHGIIQSSAIAIGKMWSTARRMLVVEIGEPAHTRDAEWVDAVNTESGPVDGLVVEVDDSDPSWLRVNLMSSDLVPEVKAGEYQIFSTDSTGSTRLARVACNSKSEVVLNEGGDYAVQFTALKEAFKELQDQHNALLDILATWITAAGEAAAPITFGPVAPCLSIADINTCKVAKVRLP